MILYIAMQLHIIPGITRGHNSRIYVQTVFENGSICFVDRDKGYTDKKRMEERMRAMMDSNQKALVRATSAEVIVRHFWLYMYVSNARLFIIYLQ